MFDFHYYHIKTKYGDPAGLPFTDTDSLMCDIETDAFYEDISMPIQCSARVIIQKTTAQESNQTKKKVIGMIKDEAGGKHITKFVELRAKLFSYLTQGYRTPPPLEPLWEKCEGVKKSVVNKRIIVFLWLRMLIHVNPGKDSLVLVWSIGEIE